MWTIQCRNWALLLPREYYSTPYSMVNTMDKWTIKTPNPVGFSLNWPVNVLCVIVFNRFYRLEIHSLMVGIFRPSLWTVAPMNEGTILVYNCPSTFSLTSPPLHKLNVQYIPTMCGCKGGGGVLNFAVDHILQEFYTSPPQTKMTSKDDIKGLVSLKFLRLWLTRTERICFDNTQKYSSVRCNVWKFQKRA